MIYYDIIMSQCYLYKFILFSQHTSMHKCTQNILTTSIYFLFGRHGGRKLMTLCLAVGGVFTVMLPVAARTSPALIIVFRIITGIALVSTFLLWSAAVRLSAVSCNANRGIMIWWWLCWQWWGFTDWSSWLYLPCRCHIPVHHVVKMSLRYNVLKKVASQHEDYHPAL